MKICVYGSASRNLDTYYLDASREFGEELAKRGHSLVFGGSMKGLMGATAEGVAKHGGEILGIAPRFFEDSDADKQICTDFIETESMSERKDLFQINADAFVILPGGIGTFDEFYETIVYKSLGQLDKPVVLYNMNGYYDKLEEFMKVAQEHKFVRVAESQLYECVSTLKEVFLVLEQDA